MSLLSHRENHTVFQLEEGLLLSASEGVHHQHSIGIPNFGGEAEEQKALSRMQGLLAHTPVREGGSIRANEFRILLTFCLSFRQARFFNSVAVAIKP